MSIQPRTRQEDETHLRWLEMYDDGYSPAQIANAYNVNPSSVRGILSRIRKEDAAMHEVTA